jgi:membrane protein DedA with SNARE-associated domain
LGAEDLIVQLGYAGFFLVLVLGGLGLPVPEEVPVILAGVLTRKAVLSGPLAFGSCLLGVIVGDFVVYFLGYYYGEKVLSLPLTRKFLTKPREAQIKGYFHRHGIKILIVGRFAVGFRTAAYLTAGILKLPALRLFLTDLFAATFSTTLMFGLGYLFAQQIDRAMTEIHRWQHWITFAVALGLSSWLLIRYYRGRRRIGQPVGPPVLVDDAPLPPDDLHSGSFVALPSADLAPATSLGPDDEGRAETGSGAGSGTIGDMRSVGSGEPGAEEQKAEEWRVRSKEPRAREETATGP